MQRLWAKLEGYQDSGAGKQVEGHKNLFYSLSSLLSLTSARSELSSGPRVLPAFAEGHQSSTLDLSFVPSSLGALGPASPSQGLSESKLDID